MPISMYELYWAAGFLEGEGCFTFTGPGRKTPQLTASQVERHPLDRLDRLFGGRIYVQRNSKVEGNIFNHWYLGVSMSVQAMMTLYPLMSPKRQAQIERVLDVWKSTKRIRLKDEMYCVNGHLLVGRNRRFVDRSASGRTSYIACRACLSASQRTARAQKRLILTEGELL
jgi:hypothetical protein